MQDLRRRCREMTRVTCRVERSMSGEDMVTLADAARLTARAIEGARLAATVHGSTSEEVYSAALAAMAGSTGGADR